MSDNLVVTAANHGPDGKLLPGHSYKAPDFTKANAKANQQLSIISRKQNTLNAIRDAFISGSAPWQHGVQNAAAVLVAIVMDSNEASRDRIRAFRELTKHLTAEMGVTLQDADGRKVKADNVEQVQELLELMKQEQGDR